jgi:hypothetical protein
MKKLSIVKTFAKVNKNAKKKQNYTINYLFFGGFCYFCMKKIIVYEYLPLKFHPRRHAAREQHGDDGERIPGHS